MSHGGRRAGCEGTTGGESTTRSDETSAGRTSSRPGGGEGRAGSVEPRLVGEKTASGSGRFGALDLAKLCSLAISTSDGPNSNAGASSGMSGTFFADCGTSGARTRNSGSLTGTELPPRGTVGEGIGERIEDGTGVDGGAEGLDEEGGGTSEGTASGDVRGTTEGTTSGEAGGEVGGTTSGDSDGERACVAEGSASAGLWLPELEPLLWLLSSLDSLDSRSAASASVSSRGARAPRRPFRVGLLPLTAEL